MTSRRISAALLRDIPIRSTQIGQFAVLVSKGLGCNERIVTLFKKRFFKTNEGEEHRYLEKPHTGRIREVVATAQGLKFCTNKTLYK